jgi:SAM-dependent methyltransferase
MTGEWNADSYHRVSNPHVNWGVAVLEHLPLAGDEVVVDLGCGTGRLTAMLRTTAVRTGLLASEYAGAEAGRVLAEVDVQKRRDDCHERGELKPNQPREAHVHLTKLRVEMSESCVHLIKAPAHLRAKIADVEAEFGNGGSVLAVWPSRYATRSSRLAISRPRRPAMARFYIVVRA